MENICIIHYAIGRLMAQYIIGELINYLASRRNQQLTSDDR